MHCCALGCQPNDDQLASLRVCNGGALTVRLVNDQWARIAMFFQLSIIIHVNVDHAVWIYVKCGLLLVSFCMYCVKIKGIMWKFRDIPYSGCLYPLILDSSEINALEHVPPILRSEWRDNLSKASTLHCINVETIGTKSNLV